jgi:hypothetical protein
MVARGGRVPERDVVLHMVRGVGVAEVISSSSPIINVDRGWRSPMTAAGRLCQVRRSKLPTAAL